MYTVARNCSSGHLENCVCDPKRRTRNESSGDGFRWGGCSDNIELGVKISNAYLDKREMGRDSKAIISLHNNEVGRHVCDTLFGILLICD